MAVYHPELKGKQGLGVRYDLNLVLDATFKLSEQIGFPRMTVRDLQKESNVSMGGIYKCIVSKQVLEDMIVEGLAFISNTSTSAVEHEKSEEIRLKQIIKGYVFLSYLFHRWYYFVFTELRTMAPHNTKRILQIRKEYNDTLAGVLGGNKLYASHMALISQDRYLKYWKYSAVSIDDFADHCLNLANCLKANADSLGSLAIDYSAAIGQLQSEQHNA